MAEIAVEVQGLVKRFGHVVAVDRLDLTVHRGEFLSLLGPSGCGKTTTLRMIGGLEIPSDGSIRIRGRDVTNDPPNRRPTSIVFQDYALFPHMTVLENVAFGLKMRGVAPALRRQRAKTGLQTVNLGGLEDRKPHQLSGGQRQRVALARSLVVEPEVLLLDEPLGALDALVRRQMQSELHRLQRGLGLTFLYVTHDQEEAMAMSDRLVVMQSGRIEQAGTPDDVYRRPRTEFVARFLGECNLLPATIVRRGPDSAEARSRDVGTTVVDLDRVAPGLTEGSACLIAIRPEDLSLGTPGASPLTGRVIERSYLGARTRYVVASGSIRLVGVANDAIAVGIGDEVRLGWRTANVCLVGPARDGATGDSGEAS